jgi:hypothetical protein
MKGTIKLSLDEKSPCEAHAEIDSMKVTISTGSEDISISGDFSSNYDKAVSRAIELSNLFLNALSWKHKIYLEVKTDSYEIEGDEGRVLGVPAMKSTAKIGLPTLIIGDIIIDPTKIGNIDANQSIAATYYRHAHFSHHPFIIFENLYKTIENIADRISLNNSYDNKSLKGKYKSKSYEKSLLLLALEECFHSNNRELRQILKSLPPMHDLDESKIFKDLTERIYEGYRNKLFHSKTAKNPYDPNKESDKSKIQEVLPLMEFIAISLLKYEEDTFH